MKKNVALLFVTMAFGLAAQGENVFSPIESLEADGRETLALDRASQYEGGFTRTNNEIVVHGVEGKRAAACWRIRFEQPIAELFGIAADAKVEAGTGRGSVLIYVDVAYEGGGNLWGQKVFFDPAPGAWQRRTLRILPERPIKFLSMYLMVRGDGTSKVRFRAPSMVRYSSQGSVVRFDGQPIVAVNPPKESIALMRDVQAKTGFAAMRSGQTTCGVRLEETVEERKGARFITMELSANGRLDDRALTFAWMQPLPEGELRYLSSPRAAAEPAGNVEWRNDLSTPCGTGGCSRWPFVAAIVDGRGMALGFDPRLPAYGRLALNGALREMHVTYDIALTAEKPSARVGFVTFPFDAADGFRGALAAYRRLFPEFNEVKVKRQGGWMPFKAISTVEGWQDFGFAVKEGDGEPDWDDANGILTFRYTEPTTWWMPASGKDGGLATMAECIARAESLAAGVGGNAAARRHAAAWKACAMTDAEGNPYGRIRDTPWCKGIVWNLNGAPGQGTNGEFAVKIANDAFAKRYAGKFPQGVDGEYIDSSELYVTADQDFNRRNFAGMATPLTFDAATLLPCVYKGLIAYEYVRGVHERCRAVGRLVMANSTPSRWWWLAPYLDVMGTETNWNREGRGWEPPGDAWLMYVRSLCGGKPYCFLQNTDFAAFTPEMCERYMQKALAYGMYPGFFSPQASSSSHYFGDPKIYGRDRALFRKYMPLCRAVGEAGWRPVNRLLPLDAGAGVHAEQFGERYVTLFNPSTNETRSVSVPRTLELVTGCLAEGALAIPPESCRVLDFRR